MKTANPALQQQEIADSLNAQIRQLYQNGQYKQAIPLAEKSLEIQEKILASDHPGVAVSLNQLAVVYDKIGRYPAAEPLYQRALAIREKALGAEHPDVATSLNNLAHIHAMTGRYAEAEPLYLRALAIREKVLGVEHPYVAVILNNLAALYDSTGRYAEAEPLFQRALAIDEKVSGAEHPDVAADLNNLAYLYETTGRYAEAEPLYVRSLSVYEKALGVEHPDVATSLNNLARLYETTGRYAKAEQLYVRALAIREKALGAEHPDVATSLSSLASQYMTTGRYALAQPLYVRALAIKEKTLGEEHPEVAASLNNLATLKAEIGQYAVAELLLKRALAIDEKVSGAEHPNVAINLNNLAILYKTTGRYAEAEALYVRALVIKEKALGAEHPDVATSLSTLANLYVTTGRYVKAEPLYQRSLSIREKLLGAHHPDVSIDLNNLAFLYTMTGRYAKAESLYQRALTITKKALGAEHPDVAARLNNLAGLYEKTGRYVEAVPLSQRALAIQEEALGAQHPDIAISLKSLASLYRATGRYNEAEPLFNRAMAIASTAGNPNLLRKIQGGYSQQLDARNNPEAAIFFGKASINTIQSMRQNISGLGKETLQKFDDTVEEDYRRLSRLLVEQGRLPEAERVLDLLKEQEYFQFVQRNTTIAPTAGQAPLTSFEAEQEKLLAAAGAPMAALSTELRPLEELKLRTPAEEARIKELTLQLDAAGAAFAEVLNQVVTTLGATRADKVENLQEAQALQETLRELGSGTVALYTVVDQESYILILITPDYRRAYTVKISATELSDKISRFRTQLKDPSLDPRPLAQELYNILLPPAARQELVEAHAVTLMWHLDGPLRYLPFAALYDGSRYLVESYRNTLFTTASLVNIDKTPKARWQGLGLGMSKARSIDGKAFNALDAVPGELSGIIRQGADTSGMIPGDRYLDEAFTWESLQESLKKKGKYPLVHIASHFNLEPGNNLKSFILTGSGEPISLEKISRKDNLFGGVDLLTLSACETAYSGGKGADGREVDGLSIMAQQKGAKAVIATLWPVADSSTAQLMADFYRLREVQKLPKVEALRQAQLALLHGSLTTPPNDDTNRSGIKLAQRNNSAGDKAFRWDQEKPFAHPYYWAPFILMGNWK